MANKTRLTVTVDQKVEDQITAISKETLVPKSALVNKILSEYIHSMFPLEADDIDYELGDYGSVDVTYKGVDYSFVLQEGKDMGAEDYGERYVEIEDVTNNETLETIYNAYNVNSLDDGSAISVAHAIKNQVVGIITNYLHDLD